MKRLINICSDEELREIAEDWCELVHKEIKEDAVNAFMIGAKLAINHNGWVDQKEEQPVSDDLLKEGFLEFKRRLNGL